jgi:GNAT superfamily N-acetyltransferase
MKFIENSLTYQEYVSLRSSVGWNNFAQEQVVKSIRNSIYDIKVVVENSTIAMGRLIGDGTYYLVVDIIVQPEYQGKGIGSKILDSITKYVEDNTPIGGRSSVQLIAEPGKEGFYGKKGLSAFRMNSAVQE